MKVFQMPISHRERHRRRQAIAADILDGRTDEEVMKKYGVTRSYLCVALREFGVPKRGTGPKKNRAKSYSAFAILRMLIDGKSQSEISREAGISRQRVNHIAKQGKDAGFDLPDN